MPERNVGCLPGRCANRNTDNFGVHIIQPSGFGIEGKAFNRRKAIQPNIELLLG